MRFTYTQPVMFKHCDPAGIVFFPRFFEMLNDTVESFFGEVLDYPFAEMHRDSGIPTAQIEARFHAPCRLGEILQIHLTSTRLGRTSLSLGYRAECKGELRFEASSTVVHVDARGRPSPWRDDTRARLADYLEEDDVT